MKHFILLMVVFVYSLSFSQNHELKFQHLSVNNGLPQNSVYSIVKDKYGFMWFGTWGGAVRYDGYNTKVFRPVANDSTALSDYRISCIVTDKFKNIWVETEHREVCYKYNYETENFKRFAKKDAPKEVQQEIYKWRREKYKVTENKHYQWLTEKNGVQQINKQTNDTVFYQKEVNNPFALSDNVTRNVLLDNQDNIWIGTQSGGVSYSNLYQKPFENFYMGSKGEGLIENSVRIIAKDKKGQWWIGSEHKGITIVNRQGDKNKFQYIGAETLSDLQVRSLYCDDDNQMWIGTKNGLFVVNNKQELLPLVYDGTILNNKIFALLNNGNQYLYIGTLNGLVLYNFKDKSLTSILGKNKKVGKYIRCFAQDEKGHIWVATEDFGVSELIPKYSKNGKLTFKIHHYKAEKNKLLSNRTYSLTIDDLGNVWVATDRGLSIINSAEQKVKNLNFKDGLPDDLMMAVEFDNHHSVWASHKKGLTKIDTRNFNMQSFNISDGLQGNEFNQNASYFDAVSGEMLFGGTNGFTSFYPKNIQTNPHAPDIAFTQLSIMHQKVKIGEPVGDRVVLKKSLVCTDSITLTWWDQVFEIEFAALHYQNSKANQYKYKLEGFDKDWIQTTAKDRKAAYANLEAGTYVFKVLAANSDGVWTTTPKTLHIKVLPPWWLSTWAIVFYVLLGLCMLWFVNNYLVSRVKLRQKEEVHQAKLHFFTEVSHEFRTPLTLIVDPLEKLMQQKVPSTKIEQYYDLMYRNAKQLLLLINQLLDFRKLESGHFSLQLQKLELISFVNTVVETFTPQAVGKNIHLQVDAKMSELFTEADEQKLNMILNNLLSNALKFTPNGGQITVGIDYENNEQSAVKIEVQDSGIGLSKKELDKVFQLFYQSDSSQKSKLGSGIGLALTKELVQLHKGTIKVFSEKGKGTTFSFWLPLSSNNQKEVIPVSKEPLVEVLKNTNTQAQEKETLPVLLFVDDHEDIRTYVSLNFSDDYQLFLAANGKEGLELAKEQLPDIIISDVMMPDMDGLTLCHHLKSNKITSHIPVILLTAKKSDIAKTEGYQTGADAYMTKPFSTQLLQARVQNLLAQRSLLQNLYANPSNIKKKVDSGTSATEKFMQEVTELIEIHLENPSFNIDFLAEKLGMSRSQLYRKMKAITNKTANEFIVDIQMQKAKEYLLSGTFNISETAYKVGYSAPNSFTRAFVKYYGMSPSQFLEKYQ